MEPQVVQPHIKKFHKMQRSTKRRSPRKVIPKKEYQPKNEKHSGNFMVSNLPDDEDQENLQTTLQKIHKNTFVYFEMGTLKKLRDYMKLAYIDGTVVSTRWKNFTGLKNLGMKNRVRLNNAIWRSWFEINKSNKDSSIFLKAPVQHTTKTNCIVAGQFWKREAKAVKEEYMNWRKEEKSKKSVQAARQKTLLTLKKRNYRYQHALQPHSQLDRLMTHHKPPNQVKVPSNQQYHPITANPWINPNNLNVNEQNKNTPKSQRGPFLRPPEPTAMDDMAIDKTRMKKMDDPYVLDSDLKDIIHELFPDERKKSDSPGDGADYINNIVNDPYGNDDEIFIHDSMPSVFSTQNSFENYGQTQQDSTCIAHTHAQGDLMRNNQGIKSLK